jgi:hypothetical protein
MKKLFRELQLMKIGMRVKVWLQQWPELRAVR